MFLTVEQLDNFLSSSCKHDVSFSLGNFPWSYLLFWPRHINITLGLSIRLVHFDQKIIYLFYTNAACFHPSLQNNLCFDNIHFLCHVTSTDHLRLQLTSPWNQVIKKILFNLPFTFMFSSILLFLLFTILRM